MENKEFREKFDKEYRNLCVGEQVVRARHKTILTQNTLVNRVDILGLARGYLLRLFKIFFFSC